MSGTVPPVSCHWSCQSGESSLRAQISGDVQAGIRLRPVNSIYLARMRGSPRCAVKLTFRDFIMTVPNILQKNFFNYAIFIKNHHLGLFGCSWRLPWGNFLILLVSAVTLTHVELKTKIYFVLLKLQFLFQRFHEKLWVWSSPCPEYDSFSGSFVNGNLQMFGSTV